MVEVLFVARTRYSYWLSCATARGAQPVSTQAQQLKSIIRVIRFIIQRSFFSNRHGDCAKFSREKQILRQYDGKI
jgi:hypothetical protein